MANRALLWLGLVLALVVAFVYWYAMNPELPQLQRPATTTSTNAAPAATGQNAGIANPASVNCVNLGGDLEIANDAATGGAVGYCHMKDGRVCEEWALMRDNTCVPPAQQ